MRRLVLALLIALPAASTALAAEPVSASHRQAATECVRAMEMEKTMVGGAAAMADAMIQSNPPLAPYRDVLMSWAAKHLTWEAFAPRVIDIYVESFTEAELRELTAFYVTPTGRKAVALMPDLMRRGALIGAEIGQAHSAELERMIRERTAELEKAISKP